MRTSWIKGALTTVAVNFLILLAGLLVIEAGGRTLEAVRLCRAGDCSFATLKKMRVHTVDRSTQVGMSRLDADLGYVPQESFSKVVDLPGWNNVFVSVDAQGFRSNGKDLAKWQKPPILVVGDSFTFGDQVADRDTWAACLERKRGVRVLNGGVFGYGAAQSLLRAEKLAAKDFYAKVIWSILVGNDFARDRLAYRGGFAVPAVIEKEGVLEWAAPPDPYRRGTKYHPRNEAWRLALYENVWIAKMLAIKFGVEMSGSRLNEEHPEAATVEAMIPWALDRFVALDVPEKIILLQYGETLENPAIQAERQLLHKEIEARGLVYVDTFEALARGDKKRLWAGHHTPEGNEVVCQALKKVF